MNPGLGLACVSNKHSFRRWLWAGGCPASFCLCVLKPGLDLRLEETCPKQGV